MDFPPGPGATQESADMLADPVFNAGINLHVATDFGGVFVAFCPEE